VSEGFQVEKLLAERFARDLGSLETAGGRLGLAVSGGPDSLALLLLAHAARRGNCEVATVDHALRPEGAAEAALVSSLCQLLDVPHTTLRIEWPQVPRTAAQEKARTARYDALGRWAEERSLPSVVTAHHRDDQTETLLMRLVRGTGVRGLAAMRPRASVPGHPSVLLLRPLLKWSRDELRTVCWRAGLEPVQDPSNFDVSYERVRIRARLAEADWIDAGALARSAELLARADEGLDWACEQEWELRVKRSVSGLEYAPAAPDEVRRRVVGRIIQELATEGRRELRGRELDRVLQALASGRSTTLRGVLCSGGEAWTFRPAAPRAG
jgi:tRNA(Ile)-lysidine synthase